MREFKIYPDKAKTLYISHPEASWAVFCWNSKGDLFLNSDWGFMGYAWRAFGDDFNEFLKKLNADYMTDKFAVNWNANSRVRMGGAREKNIKLLCQSFIDFLNQPKEEEQE